MEIKTSNPAFHPSGAASGAVKTQQIIAIKFLNKTVDFHSLPNWMKQDPYITSGYRLETKSFWACYQSLWYLHNETVNIWSHLLMGFFFLSLLLWSAFPSWHGNYVFLTVDFWALRCYLIAATLCLLFSSFYHCISCHSEHFAKLCLKLDYLGITLNITSTAISATYFGLYEHPELVTRYNTLILVCSSMTFWTMLKPRMDGARAAMWRAIIFLTLGASGCAPIIHAFSADHISPANFPMFYIVISSALYLLGTGIYVSRSPERYWPGVFDVWGASHQIFHIFVTIAQISYLLGLWTVLIKYRKI